jgi:hypothetical protein
MGSSKYRNDDICPQAFFQHLQLIAPSAILQAILVGTS